MAEVKGRVLLYSISGCPHCRSAKSKLQDVGLPYTEVNLDVFPERRPEVILALWCYLLVCDGRLTMQMIERTGGKQTLPQIFFNDVYVGGNDSLQKLMNEDPERWKDLLHLIENEEVSVRILVGDAPSCTQGSKISWAYTSRKHTGTRNRTCACSRRNSTTL